MEQGKPMMNRFGQLGLTTVSNGLNFVAQTIGILSQTHGQMYAYVMATVRIPISRLQMNSRANLVCGQGLGERKRDGVETLLTAEASRKPP